MALKHALDSGLPGKVTHATINSLWFRGLSYYDLWWRGTWQSEGGGCTLNHAVHHVDMIAWMLGLPEAVTAVISNAAHNNAEVEDLSISILQYGASGQAILSSCPGGGGHKCEKELALFLGPVRGWVKAEIQS
jgi:predicted dehydrogenase